MPIYEFICQSCGNEFEQIRSFSDSTMPACAQCGSEQVVRRVGRPAIHFKGSGWYINDSKKSNGKSNDSSSGKSADENSKGTTVDEPKTETKSETKTETKVETKSASAPTAVASD